MPELHDLTARVANLIDQARTTDNTQALIQNAKVFGRGPSGEHYDPRMAPSDFRTLTPAEVGAAVDTAQAGLHRLPGLIAAWTVSSGATELEKLAAADARMDEAIAACPVLISAFPGFYLPLGNDEYAAATWISGTVDYQEAGMAIGALRGIVLGYVYRGTASDRLAELNELLTEFEQPFEA